jgi:hypothetical protein
MTDETRRDVLIVDNEFASVRLRLVEGNRSLLRIENARTGEAVTFDPLELEALTRLTRHELTLLASPQFAGIDGRRDLTPGDLLPGEDEIAHPGT